MFSGLQDFLFAKPELKRFSNAPKSQKLIVFYSEGSGYWTHFKPILEALSQYNDLVCSYLTSERTDPILLNPPKGVEPYYIGEKTIRTLCFAGLEADTVVMTMPNLHNSYIKRSPYVRKYIYVHHSLASQHMIYGSEAFDNFDVIFCAGNHHIEETKKRERQKSLPPKELIKHGYGRLESLIKAIDEQEIPSPIPEISNPRSHVLIAPSWGPNAILERLGDEIIDQLLNAKFEVTLRPHPQTVKDVPKIIEKIKNTYGNNSNFHYDNNMSAIHSLKVADVMISDWSGAALEFAFARLKPALFIDVPRKINNKNYESLGLIPVEVSIREKIGTILPENKIQKISTYVDDLISNEVDWNDKIEKVRGETVFNIGDSGQVAAEWLFKNLNQGEKYE